MATPRKSLAAHALAGTKPNYEVDVRLSPIEAGRPRFPKDLTPAARVTFKKLCQLLQERRQLTAADGEAIRLYVLALERHRRATEHLALEGEVKIYTRLDNNGQAHQMEKANLWLKVAENAEKTMITLLNSMGLTAASRDKIKQVKPEGDDEAVIPGSIEDMRRQGLLGNVVSIAAPIVDLTQEIEKEEVEKTDGTDSVD